MRIALRRSASALALFVAAVASAGGCGDTSGGSAFDTGPGLDGSTLDGTTGGPPLSDGGGGLRFDAGHPLDGPHAFDVTPNALQTITVAAGQSTPTVVYSATLDGHPIQAAWGINRGELGSIAPSPSAQGTFTPTGTTGGLVTILAGLNGQTVTRQVFIQLTAQQSGASATESAQVATTLAQLKAGGGIGGVGGEGLGVGVSDAATLAALKAPGANGQAQKLSLLYPYDKTVFPRGLLAPLLQWAWTPGDADAIAIQLKTTSGSFSWTGTFGRPAILAQTGGAFVRHPIPQDVWAMATNTAGGLTPSSTADDLVVSLVVAKAGQAYGPITQTWTIAPARLAGTVYYNSYGTMLVQNSVEASYQNGPQFGAAVLGIAEGATGPSVVAGTASPLGSGAGCRVCHVVASNGGRLIVQHGDTYARTSAYDLKNQNAETVLTGYDNLFGWAGLSPDGTLAFTNAANLAAQAPASQLYAFPPTSSTPIPVTGIPANLQAGAPTFSADGKHVAFDFIGGTIGASTGNGSQLVALDFDSTQKAFSNLRVLATMPAGMRGGFPSFFPTNDAVAFHYQLVSSDHRYNTWHNAQAQIWWSDLLTGNAKALHALNGLNAGGATSYLPTGANHANDTVLNYEPTVNPVASGGYVWIIFTSRRLYGNVATTDPWQSDPRSYDATSLANTTTKKLWVAAIDLSAKPGTDPSHPAFYLPAQELLAGNARGFWVLDPCRPDGKTCQSGDQCCNGYCEPGAGDAGLVCTNAPPNASCSQPQERCAKNSDCCDPTTTCVNGFCAVAGPK